MREVYRFAGLRDVKTPVLHSNFAACRGSIARGAWTPQMHEKANSGECARMGAGRFSHQKTMTADTARRLMEHFRDPNRRFTELTGIPTADWDQPTKYIEKGGVGGGGAAQARRDERRRLLQGGEDTTLLPSAGGEEGAAAGSRRRVGRAALGYLDGPELLERQLAGELGREEVRGALPQSSS